jgi:2-keto-4-pentenoate hydratase
MQIKNDIQRAADQFYAAMENKQAGEPVRPLIGTTDIAAAYQVQQINIDRRIEQGARIVGRKIGLTAKVVQDQLGVNEPDFGTLLNTMQVPNGGAVPYSELVQGKAEAEIAFVMAKDITGTQVSMEEVVAAIDYAVAAIEIVGSRILNWDIRITDTIADNASASHFVLGDIHIDPVQTDLTTCRMTMKKNGETVSEGIGAACLGSPLIALHWLAQKMLDMGVSLKAGDIVLSGALGPMVAISEGDTFWVEIIGVGTVSVSFPGV